MKVLQDYCLVLQHWQQCCLMGSQCAVVKEEGPGKGAAAWVVH